ncbi:hypothetical protein ACFX1X_043845 [Malus domestica]|uniref:probable transcription factor GLK1 n=1 Tax=Malus domestica TaxID=3750 RepID=UPI00049905A1
MYGATAAARKEARAKSRRDIMMINNPNWLNAPTMGFHSITSTTPPPMHYAQHYHRLIRPLHVWGHPTMDQSMMHMWPPKHHLPHHFPSPVLPPHPPVHAHAWPPSPPPPSDVSYWHHSLSHHQRAPDAPTPGAPCFPRQLLAAPTQRFSTPSVPSFLPHAMYKVEPAGIAAPTPPQSGPHLLLDFHLESREGKVRGMMLKKASVFTPPEKVKTICNMKSPLLLSAKAEREKRHST